MTDEDTNKVVVKLVQKLIANLNVGLVRNYTESLDHEPNGRGGYTVSSKIVSVEFIDPVSGNEVSLQVTKQLESSDDRE